MVAVLTAGLRQATCPEPGSAPATCCWTCSPLIDGHGGVWPRSARTLRPRRRRTVHSARLAGSQPPAPTLACDTHPAAAPLPQAMGRGRRTASPAKAQGNPSWGRDSWSPEGSCPAGRSPNTRSHCGGSMAPGQEAQSHLGKRHSVPLRASQRLPERGSCPRPGS